MARATATSHRAWRFSWGLFCLSLFEIACWFALYTNPSSSAQSFCVRECANFKGCALFSSATPCPCDGRRRRRRGLWLRATLRTGRTFLLGLLRAISTLLAFVLEVASQVHSWVMHQVCTLSAAAGKGRSSVYGCAFRLAVLSAIVAPGASALSLSFGSQPALLTAPLDPPCGLRCWLAQLRLPIPDQDFEIHKKELGIPIDFNFSLSAMEIIGVEIGTMQAALVPPTGISYTVSGISTHFVGHWKYRDQHFPHISDQGDVAVSVIDSSVIATLQLHQDADGLAIAANLSDFSAHLQLDANFTGGTMSHILNERTIKHEILKYASSAISKAVRAPLEDAVAKNLTKLLLDVDAIVRPWLLPPVPPMEPEDVPGALDLQQSILVAALDYVLDDTVGPTGQYGINSWVDLFNPRNGTFARNFSEGETVFGEPLGYTVDAFANSTLTFGLLGLRLDGLDSWNDFNVLEAVSPYALYSHTGMEWVNVTVNFYVNVSVAGGSGVYSHLYEEGTLQVALAANEFQVMLHLAVDAAAMAALQPAQFAMPGCLRPLLQAANLTMLYFNTTVSKIQLNATSGDLESDIDAVVDTTLLLFINSFRPAMPALFNGLVDGPVRNLVNDGVAAFLAKPMSSFPPCTEPSAQQANINVFYTVLAFSLGPAVWLIVIVVPVAAMHLRMRRQRWSAGSMPLGTAGRSSTVETRPLLSSSVVGYPGHVDEKALASNNSSSSSIGSYHQKRPAYSSLVFNDRVSNVFRYGIPLVMLLNAGLYISSNTGVGASVYLYLRAGDTQVPMPALFQFTLSNSVRDMWQAGVYPLSLLIAVFSGAWPYVKLFLMLICWLVPAYVLSTRRREHLLMVLDALGKWSLIDAFVMTLMLVAFRFHIQPPDSVESHHPPVDSAAVDVYVFADWGIGAFIIATILSLISMHVVLAIHRHAAAGKYPPVPEDETGRSLCAHPLRMCGRRVRWTMFSRIAITLLLLGTAGVVCLGVVIPSFNFEFLGLAGWALELIGQPTTRTYSLLSLGLEMPSAAMDPNSINIRFLQVTFFLFSIAMPLAHLVSLLVLWVIPLTSRAQRRLFVAAEVLNAWSALDVFVIAVIASLLELRQFAAFIIGDRCDEINKLAAKYMSNFLVGGDAKCFDVITTLQEGCWVLFFACVVYIVIGTIVMRSCHSAMHEREQFRRRSAGGSVTGDAHKVRKKSCGLFYSCCAGFLFREIPDDEVLFS